MSFLRDTQPLVTTLVAGAAGAALAALAGIPAGALIGSTLSVVAVSALKFRVGLPSSLRDLAFATIGVSLGSGVDERLIGQIGTWGISLAILILSLIATLLVGRLILAQRFGMDKYTATLASSPGTMSNAIAIAVEGHGDATAVMFLQLTRLLVLVIAVPPLATTLNGAPTTDIVGTAPVTLPVLALLLAAATLLGGIGGHLGLPAASLLAGMLTSAGGHAMGLIHGSAPGWITFAAFALTGAVLGTRMSVVTLEQIKGFAVAGLTVVAAAILCSLAFAALTCALTDLSFGQVWIA